MDQFTLVAVLLITTDLFIRWLHMPPLAFPTLSDALSAPVLCQAHALSIVYDRYNLLTKAWCC